MIRTEHTITAQRVKLASTSGAARKDLRWNTIWRNMFLSLYDHIRVEYTEYESKEPSNKYISESRLRSGERLSRSGN